MPENKDDIDLDGWDLHRAAKENRVDIVRLLIEQGADAHARGKDGSTPLHHAAWDDSLEVARLLIEKGADVNARDKGGGWYSDVVAKEVDLHREQRRWKPPRLLLYRAVSPITNFLSEELVTF